MSQNGGELMSWSPSVSAALLEGVLAIFQVVAPNMQSMVATIHSCCELERIELFCYSMSDWTLEPWRNKDW